ncbi:hypothetical protein HDU98_001271 [Podochytrium sp. JEL0797]|nr:hypothetical protein HDU98_001271 [Podochytrium sp. JEL0797]
MDEPPRAVSLRTRNKNTNYALPAHIELSDADRTGQTASDSDNEEDEEIRCVCGSKDETGSNWVQCDQCKAWQHQNCVGLEGKKLPKSKNYYCEVCSPDNHPYFQLIAKRPQSTSSKPTSNQPSSATKQITTPARKRSTMNSMDAADSFLFLAASATPEPTTSTADDPTNNHQSNSTDTTAPTTSTSRSISKDHSESSGENDDHVPSAKKEKRAPASTTAPKVDGRVLANKARSKKYQASIAAAAAAAAATAAAASSDSTRNASSASSISTLVNSTLASSAHPSNSTLHSDSDMMAIDPPPPHAAAPRKPSKSSKSKSKTSKPTASATHTNHLNLGPPSPSMSAKYGSTTATGFRDTTPNKFALGNSNSNNSPHHPHNVSHRTSLADMQRRVGQLHAYILTLEESSAATANAAAAGGTGALSTPVRNTTCCCGGSVAKQQQQQPQDSFASDSSDCSVLTPPLSTTSPSPVFGTLLAQQKSVGDASAATGAAGGGNGVGSGSDSEGSGGGAKTQMLPAVDAKTRTVGKGCISCSSNGRGGSKATGAVGGRGLDDGGEPSWVILQRIRERLDAFSNEFGKGE